MSAWSIRLGQALALLVLMHSGTSSAEDLSSRLRDPRAIGRAGATIVSGDSGAALQVNPGGMVRRSQARLILSSSLSDQDASYRSDDAPSSPTITNRATPTTAPLIAYHRGNYEGTWVLGAAIMQGESETSLAGPAFGQPAADVELLFPHRYGGTNYKSSFTRLLLGGAIRVGDSLGLGASVSVAQTKVQERRRIWAGFAGRDALLSPERDLELVLRGDALLTPGASIGLLLAPPEIPFELGLAAEYRRGPRLEDGGAELNATAPEPFPAPRAGAARSSLSMPDAAILRSGIRYLGERSFVEVGAELYLQPGDSRQLWSIQNMQVIDESSATAELVEVEAMRHSRSHLALRAAVDYEAILGFLWLTGGYAWTSPSSPQNSRNPGYARLGGHTLAAGLEAAYEGYVLSLGYARSLERTRSVAATESSNEVVNPFDAGTAPANAGSYTSSADQLGFAIEVSWD